MKKLFVIIFALLSCVFVQASERVIYRKIGAKAYYKVIAPDSFGSAVLHKISNTHSHDLFWTETWANYLSKQYFVNNWLGTPTTYPIQNISNINKLRIALAILF